METNELLQTAGRAIAVYLFVLVVVRILGKREVGSFGPFDFLVALMLGEVVDEIIYGDVSMQQGAAAILVLGLCHYTTGWLAFNHRSVSRLVDGCATIVIEHGQMKPDAMRKERLSQQELMALLRQQEIEDLREVRLGVLEVGGTLSVLKEKWAESLQKSDLGGNDADAKEKSTGGEDEPPPNKRTDTPQALGWAA